MLGITLNVNPEGIELLNFDSRFNEIYKDITLCGKKKYYSTLKNKS